MNIKSLIIVIIISIATGVAIFYLSSKPANTLTTSEPHEVPPTTTTLATPTPLPSQPPIDKNTDLEAEIKQQTSPDFSEDYKKLKSEADQSF